MRLSSFPRENLYGLGDANYIVGSSPGWGGHIPRLGRFGYYSRVGLLS